MVLRACATPTAILASRAELARLASRTLVSAAALRHSRPPRSSPAVSSRNLPDAGDVFTPAQGVSDVRNGLGDGSQVNQSWSDIDNDLGVVRDVTSQAFMGRLDEFMVDLETSGSAAQAPSRQSGRTGAGERIDDHSARR
jgi:hypothetical protein